jgi:type II secretion system protein C
MNRILTKHFWVLNLVFLAAAAWLVAQISIIFVQNRLTVLPRVSLTKPSSLNMADKMEPYENYAPIVERNIFSPGEKMKLLPLEERRKSTGKGGEREDAFGGGSIGSYRLIGTVVGPGKRSYAVIEEGTQRKQKIYRQQEEFNGGKIVRITRNRVYIQREGKEEILSISKEESPIAPKAGLTPSSGDMVQKLSANRFVVNREDVMSSVQNINQFMTQALMKPYFIAGRPSGYMVSQIQSGSLIEKLGLRNNDVIKKVNGMMINKPEEIYQAYSQLLRDSNIEVEVERNDRTEVFRYEIR